ncbi:hypothetical protein F4776DRAFT_674357 [Hypoxylon sp. NC0597]|nr:hypothetical protein F4776DRAFT_674357 [Hypoxylon sp. NC0597]
MERQDEDGNDSRDEEENPGKGDGGHPTVRNQSEARDAEGEEADETDDNGKEEKEGGKDGEDDEDDEEHTWNLGRRFDSTKRWIRSEGPTVTFQELANGLSRVRDRMDGVDEVGGTDGMDSIIDDV